MDSKMVAKWILRGVKMNDNHDEHGRFSAGGGSSSYGSERAERMMHNAGPTDRTGRTITKPDEQAQTRAHLEKVTAERAANPEPKAEKIPGSRIPKNAVMNEVQGMTQHQSVIKPMVDNPGLSKGEEIPYNLTQHAADRAKMNEHVIEQEKHLGIMKQHVDPATGKVREDRKNNPEYKKALEEYNHHSSQILELAKRSPAAYPKSKPPKSMTTRNKQKETTISDQTIAKWILRGSIRP